MFGPQMVVQFEKLKKKTLGGRISWKEGSLSRQVLRDILSLLGPLLSLAPCFLATRV